MPTIYISSVTGLDDMGTILRLKRLSFLANVARLKHTVTARKVLDLALRTKNGVVPNPGWRRPRGRTWVDHGKEGTAAPFDFLMCLAGDKQAWRSLCYGPSPTLR